MTTIFIPVEQAASLAVKNESHMFRYTSLI